jgi:hypothetical protein
MNWITQSFFFNSFSFDGHLDTSVTENRSDAQQKEKNKKKELED